MGRPSRSSDQFILRMPDGMRERIKASADANNRSMNAEAVAMLEEYPELVENLGACREHSIRLRESERRLMATIGDLSAARAVTERKLAEQEVEIARLERASAEYEALQRRYSQLSDRYDEFATRSAGWRNAAEALTFAVDVTDSKERWAEVLDRVGPAAESLGGTLYSVVCVLFDLKSRFDDGPPSDHDLFLLEKVLSLRAQRRGDNGKDD